MEEIFKKTIRESISKRGLVSPEENVEEMQKMLNTKSLGELAIMHGLFKSNPEYSKKRKKPNKDKIDKLLKKADKVIEEICKLNEQILKMNIRITSPHFNYIDMSKKLMEIFPSIVKDFDDIDCSIDELFLNLTEQGFF